MLVEVTGLPVTWAVAHPPAPRACASGARRGAAAHRRALAPDRMSRRVPPGMDGPGAWFWDLIGDQLEGCQSRPMRRARPAMSSTAGPTRAPAGSAVAPPSGGRASACDAAPQSIHTMLSTSTRRRSSMIR